MIPQANKYRRDKDLSDVRSEAAAMKDSDEAVRHVRVIGRKIDNPNDPKSYSQFAPVEPTSPTRVFVPSAQQKSSIRMDPMKSNAKNKAIFLSAEYRNMGVRGKARFMHWSAASFFNRKQHTTAAIPIMAASPRKYIIEMAIPREVRGPTDAICWSGSISKVKLTQAKEMEMAVKSLRARCIFAELENPPLR